MKLFQPATAVMSRLTYPQKFLLIGALLMLPLVLVLSQFLISINYDVDFNAKERLGVEYIQSLASFLDAVQQHSAVTTAVLAGDASLSARQATLTDTVNQ